jgi:nicotinate-nucleotide adenylyltransferase
MRIGILGGTFNPVHNGHLSMAAGALKELALDQVLWVPTRIPPHKEVADRVSAEDRARMVELAIQGHPAFQLSRVELEREAPSYTIDTLLQLKKEHPSSETKWFFLVGSDAAKELAHWRRWEELRGLTQFVVIPRPGHPAVSLPQGVIGIPVAPPDISASEIRDRIRQGRSIEGLVPGPVARYIEEKGLYK